MILQFFETSSNPSLKWKSIHKANIFLILNYTQWYMGNEDMIRLDSKLWWHLIRQIPPYLTHCHQLFGSVKGIWI